MTAADVGHELRRLRKAALETQAQTAAAIGVTRANLTQWESGKYLPSPLNARQLDDHFRAANALVNLVEAARFPHGAGLPAPARANVVATEDSVATVFHRVGRALVGKLIRDEQGAPLGWRHNLQTDAGPTALSTAYGISALQEVGGPYIDYRPLVESLVGMQSPQGGWRKRSGSPRLEITSAVLDAIFRVGTPMPLDEGLELLERSIGSFSRTRPYLLSTALQTAVRLRPDAPVATALIDDLLATRLEFGGISLWPEKREPGLVGPEASVLHTARAAVALREVVRVRDDREDVREAAEQATQWLLDRTEPDHGVTEELVRPRPDGEGKTRIMIRHFTSAWVVQALAFAPQVPLGRLNQALRTLWRRYDRHSGLWAWGSGDLPIWMTLDAVSALRAATLAVAPPPLSPPREQKRE